MSQAPPRRLLTPAFLLISLSSLAYFIAQGVQLPILPRYVAGPLRGGSFEVGVAVGVYSVSALVLRPWIGALGDARGRRLLIVSGALIFGIATLGMVVASSLTLIVLMRLLSGAGEALFFVGAATAVADLAPPDRRGEAVSLFSLALYVGIGAGPFLGEAVFARAGYLPVWILSSVASLGAALLGRLIPETGHQTATTEGGSRRWVHTAALLPGIALLASVWGLAGFLAFIPLYALDLGLGGSRTVFLLYSAVVLSVRSVGARIPDVVGPGRTARVALACSTTGMLIIGLVRAAPGLFVGTFIWGLGQAFAFPALLAMAVARAPAAERGAVVGTFSAFLDVAFGIGPMTLGIISEALGYRGAFLGAAGVAGVGLITLLRSPGAASTERPA